MAYSNTNKDKVQGQTGEKIKKGLWLALLLVITFFAWSNIIQQSLIMKEAEDRNKSTYEKLSDLNDKNRLIEKQIATATSSTEQQRKTREALGWGQSGDQWIEADLEKTDEEQKTAFMVSNEAPVIVQWWSLFTK